MYAAIIVFLIVGIITIILIRKEGLDSWGYFIGIFFWLAVSLIVTACVEGVGNLCLTDYSYYSHSVSILEPSEGSEPHYHKGAYVDSSPVLLYFIDDGGGRAHQSWVYASNTTIIQTDAESPCLKVYNVHPEDKWKNWFFFNIKQQYEMVIPKGSLHQLKSR